MRIRNSAQLSYFTILNKLIEVCFTDTGPPVRKKSDKKIINSPIDNAAIVL